MKNMFSKNLFGLLLILSSCYCAHPNDCILSEWSQWGPCSNKCTPGIKTMTRTIMKAMTDIFAKPCDRNQTHSVPCGVKNNGCEQFCDVKSGDCGCRMGLKLNSDNKTCMDNNECEINFGRGPCVQKCINTFGSYHCGCNPSYYLAKDKHNCVFNKSAYPCNFETHKYDKNDNCVCKEFNREGIKCNQDKLACKSNKCNKDSVCLRFIHTKEHCVNKDFLVPILLPLPLENFMERDFRYIVEMYITNILEGGKPKTPLFKAGFSKVYKNNDISNQFFYVEGSKLQHVKSFTYAQYIVLNIEDFSVVDRSVVCSKLHGTDVSCVDNKQCNIIKSDGRLCSFAYTQPSTMTKASSSKVWVIVIVCLIILLVLIFGVICFVKRRHKWKRFSMAYSNRNEEVSCRNESPLLNHTNEPPPPYSVNDGDNSQHIGNFDSRVFQGKSLDNDDNESPNKHIYESVENLKSKLPAYPEYESMNSTEKKSLRVDLPDNEEEPRYVTPPSRGGPSSSSSIPEPQSESYYSTNINNKPLVDVDEENI